MTSRKQREPVITMTTVTITDLARLLTTLDEFLRSSPRITRDLAAFLSSRGARFPELDVGNMTDELSFTALSLRHQAASPAATQPPRRLT